MLTLLLACAHSGTESVVDGRYVDTPGTVALFSDDLWTLTPDADPSTRLCLDDPLFTEALHVDGANNMLVQRNQRSVHEAGERMRSNRRHRCIW